MRFKSIIKLGRTTVLSICENEHVQIPPVTIHRAIVRYVGLRGKKFVNDKYHVA